MLENPYLCKSSNYFCMKYFKIIASLFLIIGLILLLLPKKIDITVEHAYNLPEKDLYQNFNDLKKFNQFNAWVKKEIPVIYKDENRYEQIQEKQIYSTFKIVQAEPYSKVKYEVIVNNEVYNSEITISKQKDKSLIKWQFTSEEIPFFSRFSALFLKRELKVAMEKTLQNLEKTPVKLLKQESEKGKIEVITLEKPIQMVGIVQEISNDDRQEKIMAFSESMGILYSYLTDVQKLSAGTDFSEGISVIEKQEGNNTQYCIGFITNKNLALGEGMVSKTIPATKVVKMLYKGSYSATEKAHQQIKEYITKNNLTTSGSPFEVYKSGQSVPERDKIAEIYYPVK